MSRMVARKRPHRHALGASRPFVQRSARALPELDRRPKLVILASLVWISVREERSIWDK